MLVLVDSESMGSEPDSHLDPLRVFTGQSAIMLPDAPDSHTRGDNMDRTVRVQGAIMRQDELLLIKHREHDGGREYWLLPGGGPEPGESDEAALQREIAEETHLTVAVEQLLLDEPSLPEDAYQRHRTYLCRPLAGEARPGCEPEPEVASVYAIVAVGWIDLRDEAAWHPEIRNDPIIYPRLKRLQAALGLA
jgi:8-oxo-dGTP pyrophosphatase MutT (NUDIX family)